MKRHGRCRGGGADAIPGETCWRRSAEADLPETFAPVLRLQHTFPPLAHFSNRARLFRTVSYPCDVAAGCAGRQLKV